MCPSCGNEVRAAARFCPICGAQLETDGVQPAAAAIERDGVEATTTSGPAVEHRRSVPIELVAALIPAVALAVVVATTPSVLEEPSLYVLYAFLQTLVFLLLIRFVDLYEREPFVILTVMMLWGGFAAVVLALIGNATVEGGLGEEVRLAFGSAIAAPLVEEAAKGLALVAAFALSQWANRRYGWMEFEGVTDGIVYGAAVGLGFALVEDVQYLLLTSDRGTLGEGLDVFADRVDLFGVMSLGHAVYTAAFGAGLGLAACSRTSAGRIGWPVVGFAVGVLLHASWNGMSTVVLWSDMGWDATVALMGCVEGIQSYCNAPLPAGVTEQTITDALDQGRLLTNVVFYASLALLVAAIVFWLRYQRRIIRLELAEETQAGLVAPSEPALILNHSARTRAYLDLVKSGRLEEWRVLRRLHHELAELAFAKWRARVSGQADEFLAQRRRRVEYLQRQLVAARELETAGAQP